MITFYFLWIIDFEFIEPKQYWICFVSPFLSIQHSHHSDTDHSQNRSKYDFEESYLDVFKTYEFSLLKTIKKINQFILIWDVFIPARKNDFKHTLSQCCQIKMSDAKIFYYIYRYFLLHKTNIGVWSGKEMKLCALNNELGLATYLR